MKQGAEIIVLVSQLFLIRDQLCPQVSKWGPGRFSNLLGNYWPVILPGWKFGEEISSHNILVSCVPGALPREQAR